MPRARARQTTINDHFSPRATRSSAARPTRASQARPYSQVHRFHSDSEGEEGIANIPLDPLEAGPSQVRVKGRTILDSEDEEEEEERDVSPAKRRRRKETLKRPNPNPDPKAAMSIPAYREKDYPKRGHNEEGDEEESDEESVERRLTRREGSSSEGEVIDVADTEDDQPAAPSPTNSDIVILDAPEGSFAERRDSGIMDNLASGSASNTQRHSGRRFRDTPVIEVPASSGRALRQRAGRRLASDLRTGESSKANSAPTQSTSHSLSSRSRLRPVIELRSWSQEELRPYSLSCSPNPDPTLSESRSVLAARGAPDLSAKRLEKARGEGRQKAKRTDRQTNSPVKPAPASKADTTTTTSRKAPPAPPRGDSPIALDDDDIPLSLPVPASVRSQRLAARPARPMTVSSDSDSSQPIRKRHRRTDPKQPTAVQRNISRSPPVKQAPAFIMPMVSDSEEDPSPQPKRNADSVMRRGVVRPETTIKSRNGAPLLIHDSDSDEVLSAGGAAVLAQGSGTPGTEREGLLRNRPAGANIGHPEAKSSGRKGKARQTHYHAPGSDDSDEEDIQMDEMKRFKTESRLRKQKETPFQRNLRKMKAKQRGIIESTTEEEDEEVDTDEESSAESANDSDEFYVTDDDDDEAARQQMPAEFRIDSAQTPEYKFKVVLHYFVYLVVNGPRALPLRGKIANYFGPMLRDVRRLLEGYRNSRVRSQIWRAEFVRVLEKYPEYNVTELKIGHTGCDACHISGRFSKFQVRLEGDPYDPETHEPYEVDSQEERQKEKKKKARAKRRARRIVAGSEPSSSEEDEEPRLFHIGQYCNARARTYHAMSHWEDTLYYRVRAYVKLLRRAFDKSVPSDSEASSSDIDSDEPEAEREDRRSEREMRRANTRRTIVDMRRKGSIPRYNDVDAITQWMDDRGDQAKELRWFNELINNSEALENNKNKTDD